MNLPTAVYAEQSRRWPAVGRHILAHFDAETIVVYQAYRDSIADAAMADGRLGGGGFSFDRMSWIKPNFLWMMYRAGWATKPGQERILAIRITRAGFDTILQRAEYSSYERGIYADEAAWQAALRASTVRLQWDPDHDPAGNKQPRRAIQLGLRGKTLRQFATEWTTAITDLTAFVREQSAHTAAHDRLLTPTENVYPVPDESLRARLQLAAPDAE